MGATKEQAELTRKRLLEAGLKVFSEKGFAATRLEDIVKEAKVTRGAFYWHFKNKLELFSEVFDEAMDEIQFETRTILKADVSSYEKLRRFILYAPVKLLDDEEFCAIGRLRYKIEWTKDVEEVVKEAIHGKPAERQNNLLIQTIEEGKAAGKIRTDLPTSVIRHMVIIFLMGLIHQVLERKEALKEKDILTVVECFLESITQK